MTTRLSGRVGRLKDRLLAVWAERSIWSALFWCALAVFTLAPILRIINAVATAGTDNPSNDEASIIRGFVAPVLRGGYNWSHAFRDTFVNTHCDLVPGLILAAIGYLAKFNVFVAIYLGILFSLMRLLLLHSAFTSGPTKAGAEQGSQRDGRDRRLGALLWPLLAALVFSVTQIAVFEHAYETLELGLNQLGLALGVWAIARYPGRWKGVLLMSAAGLVATWSFGSGAAMWPAFGLGLFLAGYRRKSHYVAWVAAAAVSLTPYIVFVVWNSHGLAIREMIGLFRPLFILDLLGRPFTNGLNTGAVGVSQVIGAAGLVLACLGAACVVRRRHVVPLSVFGPSLVFMAFGILCSWEISIFRTLIAPWYSALTMTFWLGLAGMGFGLLSRNRVSLPGEARWNLRSPRMAWTLGAALPVVVALLFVYSNRTRADKSFFMKTRAPVSVACLRHYDTAPTYCDNTLVLWRERGPDYLRQLAGTLEDARLSVFGPHQEWSLQGESILETVHYYDSLDSPGPGWSVDMTDNEVALTDYRRLNLILPSHDWVSWQLSLPKGLAQARFDTAIAISTSAQAGSLGDGVDFDIYLQVEDGPELLAFSQRLSGGVHHWTPVTIPLGEFEGKGVRIRLAANGEGACENFGMFHFPRVVMDILESEPSTPLRADVLRGHQVPSNTDVAASSRKPGESDLRLGPATGWNTERMTEADEAGEARASGGVASWSRQGSAAVPVHVAVLNEGGPAIIPASLGRSTGFGFEGFDGLVWASAREPVRVAANSATSSATELATGGRRWMVTAPEPELEYTWPIDEPLKAFSHFYLKMARGAGLRNQAVDVYCTVKDGDALKTYFFVLPLLPGSRMHSYTYDLRLLGARRTGVLVGVKIIPAYFPRYGEDNSITIEDIRFLRK